jgi:hypothetical protein
LCDGSVRFISSTGTLGLANLQLLARISDGEAAVLP